MKCFSVFNFHSLSGFKSSFGIDRVGAELRWLHLGQGAGEAEDGGQKGSHHIGDTEGSCLTGGELDKKGAKNSESIQETKQLCDILTT